MAAAAAAMHARRQVDARERRAEAEARRREQDAEDEEEARRLGTSQPVDLASAALAIGSQSQEDLKLPEVGLPSLSAMYDDPPADAVIGPSGKTYGPALSMWCMGVHHPLRRFCISTVESRPFDPIILTTIICNCITMAWESPLDPCCTRKAAFIDVCEWIYLFIFTFELLIKVANASRRRRARRGRARRSNPSRRSTPSRRPMLRSRPQ